MFLYRLIVQIFILRYFDVVKSTDLNIWEHEPAENNLEKEYVMTIVKKKRNVKEKYKICSDHPTDEDKMIVMTACTYTFGKLRIAHDRYRHRLYVYHNHYETINKSMCITNIVALSRSYGIRSDTKQAMIQCFGRLPISKTSFLKPTTSETINTVLESDFFYQFLIFPTDDTFSSWLVFEYNRSSEIHALVKWYYTTSKIENSLLPVNLLIFQPPMETSDISEIYAILYPFILNWAEITTSGSHVLHQVDSTELTNLCIKITGARKKTITAANIAKPFPSSYPLILESPKVHHPITLETFGYNCNTHVAEKKWFLFTAPGDDAILLGQLRTSSYGTEYIIKKYVKNVYNQFISYLL